MKKRNPLYNAGGALGGQGKLLGVKTKYNVQCLGFNTKKKIEKIKSIVWLCVVQLDFKSRTLEAGAC